MQLFKFFTIIALFCALFVAACAPSKKRRIITVAPTLANSATEPDDQALNRAIKNYLHHKGAPSFSRYEYTRIDLNQDGPRDALVLMKTPYGHWCGQHGCTLLIFRAQGASFAPVNEVRPVRPPFYVSPITSNNWHDLIIRVSGREGKAKNVALQFNGQQYPSDPTPLAPYAQAFKNENIKIFP